MLNFEQLLKLGLTAVEAGKSFIDSYNGAKVALSQTELDQLQPILDQVREQNRRLAKDIDEAAAEAEQK